MYGCLIQGSHAFLIQGPLSRPVFVQNRGVLHRLPRKMGDERSTNLRISGNGDEDEESEVIHFNDFGDFVAGGETPAVPSALQDRIRETKQQEIVRDTMLMRNFKQGDWMVRGFSLDPEDAIASDTTSTDGSTDIHVTQGKLQCE